MRAAGGVSLVLILLCAVGLILTGAFRFLAGMVISAAFLVYAVRKKNKDGKMAYAGGVLANVLLILFMNSVPPSFDSGLKWQYPFQRGLIGVYQNIHEPEYFPDITELDCREYRFFYIPAIMQGSGVYCVDVTLSQSDASIMRERYSAMAKASLPISEEDKKQFADSYGEGFLMIHTPNGVSDNAEVYVLDAVLSSNHPHSSAVIIDGDRVVFSQLG